MPSEKRSRQRVNRAGKQQIKQRQSTRRNLRRGLTRGLLFAAGLFAFYLIAVFLSRQRDEMPSAYLEYRDQPTACGATAPPPEVIKIYEGAGDPGLGERTTVTATLTTSCGDVTIELDRDAAPETVASFVFLGKDGFYDGTVFHRVVDGFVAQGGDPNADGSGGPGYTLADEFPPEGFVYDRGAVAMANRGRNTSGSQFFAVIGPDAGLQNLFTVFGRVTEGMETFDAMLEVDRVLGADGSRSNPLETIYLDRVVITET